MNRFRFLCIASSVALLAACSSTTGSITEDGGTADVDVRADGAVHVETQDGTYDAGANQLPKDWPSDAPTYPGATIQYAASVNPATGKAGSAVVLMTTDAADAVAARYTDDLKAAGWTITATATAQGMTTMTASKDTRTLSLLITGQDGVTTVTMGVEMGE